MAYKGHHHSHKVSSFSPAWCLRPPPTKDSSPRAKPPSNKSQSQRQSQSREYVIEPSSPRIGCLGQVRRRKASGSSPQQSSTTSPSNFAGQFNLLLIKRVISSKILFKEMDPPRPVEKKEVKEEDSVSLWKRRCGRGDVLKLQLQPTEQVYA